MTKSRFFSLLGTSYKLANNSTKLFLIALTDFDTKLSDKDIRDITQKMDEGFNGGNMETLRKNLHGFLRPQILNAKYFRKIFTKSGAVKYEICKKGAKDYTKLKLGRDITCDDLAPLKLTKKDILRELEKITVNESNIDMEKTIEDFVKDCI